MRTAAVSVKQPEAYSNVGNVGAGNRLWPSSACKNPPVASARIAAHPANDISSILTLTPPCRSISKSALIPAQSQSARRRACSDARRSNV